VQKNIRSEARKKPAKAKPLKRGGKGEVMVGVMFRKRKDRLQPNEGKTKTSRREGPAARHAFEEVTKGNAKQ